METQKITEILKKAILLRSDLRKILDGHNENITTIKKGTLEYRKIECHIARTKGMVDYITDFEIPILENSLDAETPQ